LIAIVILNGREGNEGTARSQTMSVFAPLGAEAQRNMELAKQGKVRVGMIPEQCEMAWGKPERIQRVAGATHEVEYWFYANGSTLYFENETLKLIQTCR